MAQGRYTIVGKLADGGMAEIFLARQHGAEGFEKPVVLKRILSGFSADPQFRNMFIDEAHISMGLSHSNIVHVLDLGVGEGRLFLVLELVDGWDLEYVLERADAAMMPLPPSLGLYIIGEVLRALAYAHGRKRGDGTPMGIVHRDVSPNNVLLSAQGEVKLADFGIATAATKRERTAAGIIKGKVGFMSPEQASGNVLDARSDIYAVGTVLYLLMTRRKPFQAATDLESILRVQRNEYRPPRELNDKISPEVSSLIMRAMRLHPAERFQRAEDMLTEVEKVLRTEFKSAGQTELKQWLEELGRQDGIQPFGETQMGAVMPSRAAKVEYSDLGAGTQIELSSADKVTGEATALQEGVTPPPLPLTPPPRPATPPTGRAAGMPSELPPGTPPVAGPEARQMPPPLPALAVSPLLVPPRKRRPFLLWGLAVGLLVVLVLGVFAAPQIARLTGKERDLTSFRRKVAQIVTGDDAAKSKDESAATEREKRAPEGTEGVEPTPAPSGTASVGEVKAAPSEPTATPPAADSEKTAGAPPTPPAGESPPKTEPPGDKVAGGPEGRGTAGKPEGEAKEPEPEVKEPKAETKTATKPTAGNDDDDDSDDEEKLSKQLPTSSDEVVEDEGSASKARETSKDGAKAGPPVVSLHLASSPSGAIVKVGKRVLGRTPLSLRFRSQNSYELVFVKAGYQTTTKRVSVTPKSKGLTVSLPKAKAKKKSLLHR